MKTYNKSFIRRILGLFSLSCLTMCISACTKACDKQPAAPATEEVKEEAKQEVVPTDAVPNNGAVENVNAPYAARLQSDWDNLKGKILVKWNKLTEKDLVEDVNQNFDKLVDKISTVYGEAKESVEGSVREFMDNNK